MNICKVYTNQGLFNSGRPIFFGYYEEGEIVFRFPSADWTADRFYRFPASDLRRLDAPIFTIVRSILVGPYGGRTAMTGALGKLTGFGQEVKDTQAALFRCVFGPENRPAQDDVSGPGSSFLAWANGLAIDMTRRIWGEGRWGDLPVLADVLEDAGCTSEAVLSHLRSSPHCKGCWVIDSLMDLDQPTYRRRPRRAKK